MTKEKEPAFVFVPGKLYRCMYGIKKPPGEKNIYMFVSKEKSSHEERARNHKQHGRKGRWKYVFLYGWDCSLWAVVADTDETVKTQNKLMAVKD
jgi:hypothetical protein